MKVSFRQNLLPEEGGFAVKRKRFSVEQIVAVLKQAEVGVPVAELIRQVGISEQTLYRWKEAVQGAGNRPGPPVQAAARRECAAEAAGSRAGQDDAAGRLAKKL
jgi:transposase-like protein